MRATSSGASVAAADREALAMSCSRPPADSGLRWHGAAHADRSGLTRPSAAPPRPAGRSAHAPAAEKSVKQADRPDSVRRRSLRERRRDRHSSGPGVAPRLGATYPPAPRATSTPAYLVLLRAEIARFTRDRAAPRTRVLSAKRAGARLFAAAAPPEPPACAGARQTTSCGTPCPTRLCCSDPHLAVDSR